MYIKLKTNLTRSVWSKILLMVVTSLHFTTIFSLPFTITDVSLPYFEQFSSLRQCELNCEYCIVWSESDDRQVASQILCTYAPSPHPFIHPYLAGWVGGGGALLGAGAPPPPPPPPPPPQPITVRYIREIEWSHISSVLQTLSKSFRHYSLPRVVWGLM
jgi:hypothetical protein